MLHEIAEKVKELSRDRGGDLFFASIIFFTGISCFGLGRLSLILPHHEQMRIIQDPVSVTKSIDTQNENILETASGRVVGSKNGSLYHLPNCPGAAQIKEENKIWFASAALAGEAGYQPAGNCPGLR